MRLVVGETFLSMGWINTLSSVKPSWEVANFGKGHCPTQEPIVMFEDGFCASLSSTMTNEVKVCKSSLTQLFLHYINYLSQRSPYTQAGEAPCLNKSELTGELEFLRQWQRWANEVSAPSVFLRQVICSCQPAPVYCQGRPPSRTAATIFSGVAGLLRG